MRIKSLKDSKDVFHEKLNNMKELMECLDIEN